MNNPYNPVEGPTKENKPQFKLSDTVNQVSGANGGAFWQIGPTYPGGYYPPIPKGTDIDSAIDSFKHFRATQEVKLFTIEEVENGYVVKKDGKTYVCFTTGLATLIEALTKKH